MAIVSNKFHDAVCQLSRCYFGELLPVSIGENEAAGIRKEPAPDTVFTALERLGSTVEHAVYIGDSEVDAATARNAGMDCILVSWGFREERELLASYRSCSDCRSAVGYMGSTESVSGTGTTVYSMKYEIIKHCQ